MKVLIRLTKEATAPLKEGQRHIAIKIGVQKIECGITSFAASAQDVVNRLDDMNTETIWRFAFNVGKYFSRRVSLRTENTVIDALILDKGALFIKAASSSITA